jgi:hypothetical protein
MIRCVAKPSRLPGTNTMARVARVLLPLLGEGASQAFVTRECALVAVRFVQRFGQPEIIA